MKDRVPGTGKANRKLITPESGSPFYAIVTHADEAVEEGTPLNKANLLTDATAALLALTGEPTIDAALAVLAAHKNATGNAHSASPGDIGAVPIGTNAVYTDDNWGFLLKGAAKAVGDVAFASSDDLQIIKLVHGAPAGQGVLINDNIIYHAGYKPTPTAIGAIADTPIRLIPNPASATDIRVYLASLKLTFGFFIYVPGVCPNINGLPAVMPAYYVIVSGATHTGNNMYYCNIRLCPLTTGPTYECTVYNNSAAGAWVQIYTTSYKPTVAESYAEATWTDGMSYQQVLDKTLSIDTTSFSKIIIRINNVGTGKVNTIHVIKFRDGTIRYYTSEAIAVATGTVGNLVYTSDIVMNLYTFNGVIINDASVVLRFTCPTFGGTSLNAPVTVEVYK